MEVAELIWLDRMFGDDIEGIKARAEALRYLPLQAAKRVVSKQLLPIHLLLFCTFLISLLPQSSILLRLREGCLGLINLEAPRGGGVPAAGGKSMPWDPLSDSCLRWVFKPPLLVCIRSPCIICKESGLESCSSNSQELAAQMSWHSGLQQ